MRSLSWIRLMVFALSAVLAVTGLTLANGLNSNEVVFSGLVQAVIVNGEGVGTLFVALDTIQLRVLVNPKTLLQDGDTLISMDTLAGLSEPAGSLRVEVAGKFSSGGILAGAVRVLGTEGDNAFEIRGHITGIQANGSATLMSLLGIEILVLHGGAEEDTIILKDGMEGSIADLAIGTKVAAGGFISQDGVWVATMIRIVSPGMRRGMVFFEGIVTEYDPDTGIMMVQVAGATEDTRMNKVFITPETRIRGDLEVGSYILFIGHLNPDYAFTAREIRVLAGLEIKPDERKLKLEEEALFTVKLRETAPELVTVSLRVDPPGALELPAFVEIEAGEQTADFTVKALAVGPATITAAAADLGEATALVKVGELSDDDTERPDAELRLFFSPDHVKVKAGEVREVVLHVKPPQPADAEITFTSSDETVVKVLEPRVLSNGSAQFKVPLQAEFLTETKTAIVTAMIGGIKAELFVEVSVKKKN